MQKSIILLMPLGSDFSVEFNGWILDRARTLLEQPQSARHECGARRVGVNMTSYATGGGGYLSPYPLSLSPGPPVAWWRRLLERLVGHLAALLFSIVFSIPFLIDLCSILPPSMAPKINQNQKTKKDAKMHPILGSVF